MAAGASAPNRPARLADCLRALSVQTFLGKWEIVVVDDGSPNYSAVADVLKKARASIEATAGRTLHVVRQSNAGPASARNAGILSASGQIVAFTDDDCSPSPDWLERLVMHWRLHPSAMIGGTTLNGLPAEIFASASQLIVDLVYEHFNRDPSHAYCFASNNFRCGKAQFPELRGFDLDFPRAGAEDGDFCDQWRDRGWRLIWLENALVLHRHRQSFRQFVTLHLRYGLGAFIYQTKRRRWHSGRMSDDFAFHQSLLQKA